MMKTPSFPHSFSCSGTFGCFQFSALPMADTCLNIHEPFFWWTCLAQVQQLVDRNDTVTLARLYHSNCYSENCWVSTSGFLDPGDQWSWILRPPWPQLLLDSASQCHSWQRFSPIMPGIVSRHYWANKTLFSSFWHTRGSGSLHMGADTDLPDPKDSLPPPSYLTFPLERYRKYNVKLSPELPHQHPVPYWTVLPGIFRDLKSKWIEARHAADHLPMYLPTTKNYQANMLVVLRLGGLWSYGHLPP